MSTEDQSVTENGDSVRKERSLPTVVLPPDEIEADVDASTVVNFTPLSLRVIPDGTEVVSEDREPPAPEPKETSGDQARPVSRGRSESWPALVKTCAKALGWLVAFPFLCILPFIVVLRIAVVAYQESAYAGWESLGLGIIAAVLLVCIYIAVFIWTFGIRWRFYMPLLNICLTAMLFYSGYALFHLATSNAKTEEVRSYYTSLHPFLRIAVKNLTFIDEDLVVTDTHRTKKEYQSMGLQPRQYSLHFRQPTGFVHAVDIRTNGRSKVTNLLVELYFVLMGFETLRHVGTADHLHVSLPLVETEALATSSDN